MTESNKGAVIAVIVIIVGGFAGWQSLNAKKEHLTVKQGVKEMVMAEYITDTNMTIQDFDSLVSNIDSSGGEYDAQILHELSEKLIRKQKIIDSLYCIINTDPELAVKIAKLIAKEEEDKNPVKAANADGGTPTDGNGG